MRLLFSTCTVWLLAACSTTVDSDYNRGKHTIKCTNVVGRCHDKARNLCPDGYLVTNRVRPQKKSNDTQYTLNIKCRGKAFY